MNIAHIEEQSFIYGPGCRFVIWVQGCSIHCKGCWNTQMWSFNPNQIITVDDLMEKILNEKDSIEGITLLGGEPLDQFEEIKELVSKSKDNSLTVMLFTGYEMEEIIEKGWNSILNNLDIIISGRYDYKKRTLNHQWIGSTNQEIHFLTDKYNESCLKNGNYVEITLIENGSTNILGFPKIGLLNAIKITKKWI